MFCLQERVWLSFGRRRCWCGCWYNGIGVSVRQALFALCWNSYPHILALWFAHMHEIEQLSTKSVRECASLPLLNADEEACPDQHVVRRPSCAECSVVNFKAVEEAAQQRKWPWHMGWNAPCGGRRICKQAECDQSKCGAIAGGTGATNVHDFH